MNETQKKLVVNDSKILSRIVGRFDENLKTIENNLGVEIILRNDTIKTIGPKENVEEAVDVLKELQNVAVRGDNVSIDTTNYIISENENRQEVHHLNDKVICYTTRGKPIKPKTITQQKYVEAIDKNDIVFGVGPAGTGKTYLAMTKAISAFKNEEVDRLILTRPAVEAGERLGFLPGDLQEKVDPYLRPLYDALFEILGPENFRQNLEKGTIEVAPLAYMRGRTLDNAFIILDEAQNTTSEQMKMFLTRFGKDSKVIVTGDMTQIDLPRGQESGLIEAQRILKDIEGIKFIEFSSKDVVRHRLVQKIIEAYDRRDKKL